MESKTDADKKDEISEGKEFTVRAWSSTNIKVFILFYFFLPNLLLTTSAFWAQLHLFRL